jgi:Flp pilus assembly pilin Flp
MASTVSDVDSALTSRFSDLNSYLRSVTQSTLSDIDSAMSSQYTKVYSGINKVKSNLGSTIASTLSDIDSALTSRFSDVNSFLRSVLASNLSDVQSAIDSEFAIAGTRSGIRSMIDARLDTAFTDATSLNSNSLKDRLRTMGWILRNKMKVNDATGVATLYKDDDATTALTNTLTDNGVSTLRTKLT